LLKILPTALSESRWFFKPEPLKFKIIAFLSLIKRGMKERDNLGSWNIIFDQKAFKLKNLRERVIKDKTLYLYYPYLEK